LRVRTAQGAESTLFLDHSLNNCGNISALELVDLDAERIPEFTFFFSPTIPKGSVVGGHSGSGVEGSTNLLIHFVSILSVDDEITDINAIIASESDLVSNRSLF